MSNHAWIRRRNKRANWTREQWDAYWRRKHKRDWSWAQGKNKVLKYWLGSDWT